MYKATYNLTFGDNHSGKTETNRQPRKNVSKMPNTKVSMRSGGRSILQIQGRPRSLDSEGQQDNNAKPRPFYNPHGADHSENQGAHSVKPLTQQLSSDQDFNKSPRPFRKSSDTSKQAPRATSYPVYPSQKKVPELGTSYLPERKKVASVSSMDRLGSDLDTQKKMERGGERSPGWGVPPPSPRNREAVDSPKPSWSSMGPSTSPARPQPTRSPRRQDSNPGSPRPPWSPPARDMREQSPVVDPPWVKSPRDTRERTPTKDPPWKKAREPSPKEIQPPWRVSLREGSPAKENRPPGSRDMREKSPLKDPRPPWSVGARDVSPKNGRSSGGRGQSPRKDTRPGDREQSPKEPRVPWSKEPSPRRRGPQWPNTPREPSPSKEQMSPGGRGQSPRDKPQWSPGGRGSSPGKDQRPPWSPGGRGLTPPKDMRPPWMSQSQGRDKSPRIEGKPGSRGGSPGKDPRPPWLHQTTDQTPGLDVPVSHQPPKSPRTRGQSPTRTNQVRDARGQSPGKQEKPRSHQGEREHSPKEQKQRPRRDQSPARLPPAGQGSPRMSRAQRSGDTHRERTKQSPQRVSPKRPHPPEVAGKMRNEQDIGPSEGVRGQQQYPRHHPGEQGQDSDHGRRGRDRVRRQKSSEEPQRVVSDVNRVRAAEQSPEDSLSERDDEVARILSGILQSTSPSHQQVPAIQSQEQPGESRGHAFEPYGRHKSPNTKSSQPHSHFYQSLQVNPLQDDRQRREFPSSSEQNTPSVGTSGPTKVLLKSASVSDPMSFEPVPGQEMPPNQKGQQSPRTRRQNYTRAKTFQAEIVSDHESSDSTLVEGGHQRERINLAPRRKLSTDSAKQGEIGTSFVQATHESSDSTLVEGGHQRERINLAPRRKLSTDSARQGDFGTSFVQAAETGPPLVPKVYKPSSTLTFINGVPVEAPIMPPKKVGRSRRHGVPPSVETQQKSMEAEMQHEQAEQSNDVEDFKNLSDFKHLSARERSPGKPQEYANRYSGAYDNVHGTDHVMPPMHIDRTDGALRGMRAPPSVDQGRIEPLGNPAVFVDVGSYGDLGDLEGSGSLLQLPEDIAQMRTSPSVREMAAERELAEAAAHKEEPRIRRKKTYGSRKMSMPVESQIQRPLVRRMSFEGPPADLTSSSETDERSRRTTPIQPHDAMAFRMRTSKFRHVFGEANKKDKCYENVRISKNQHDSMFCAVNPKFLAVIVESAGGGAFLVLPIKQVGRIDINAPKVCGHAGPVLDIKWSPFNDHQIASCSDDATIKVWEVPEDGLQENLSEWIVDLHGHQRRIGYIEWHPTAEHILLSAGFDYNVILWNIETAEPINIITCHTDTIYSISWNREGSLFATTSKDKKIRVIDPRSGSVISEGAGHIGPKSSKVVFLDSMRLFTTGFSRMSERQYGIWDINDLSKPLRLESIDSSSGVLLPYYDIDNKVMFLIGKGDGNIRYYEIVNEAPYCHFLNAYLSGQPQKGFGVMPKRGVDLTKCEIVRFFKLLSSKPMVEPISMRVPRKSEMFQEDIYPPTASSIPSLSAMEWINGQNRDPILVSLKDGAMQPTNTPTITTYKAVSRSLLNNNDTQPLDEPMETQPVPASVQNIRKLSVSEDRIPNLDEILDGRVSYDDDPKRKRESFHERISAFETKAEPINRPSPPPMLANTTRQVSIEKKAPPTTHWTEELPRNGLPKSDGEALGPTPEEVGNATPEQKVHVKKVWTPKSPQTEEPPLENGLAPKTDPELRKAYFRQLEEIHSLKEQILLKDKRIRQLEEELAVLKDIDNANQPDSESNC